MRLLMEMRACRSSTSALLLAAACYVAAVTAELGWLAPQGGPRGVMIEEGCELVGNLFVLLAMTLHARYVLLEAQGLLGQKKAKAEKPPKPQKPAKVLAETATNVPPVKAAEAKVAVASPAVAAAKLATAPKLSTVPKVATAAKAEVAKLSDAPAGETVMVWLQES